MSFVNAPIRKKDAMSLVTGKSVYTGDLIPQNALVVKLLTKPSFQRGYRVYRHRRCSQSARVCAVSSLGRMRPDARFTTAGQTYPEPSPYDRLILDRQVRCCGRPGGRLWPAETEAGSGQGPATASR